MFDLDNLDLPVTDNTHSNRLRILWQEGYLPQNINNIFYVLRKKRNDAVHEGYDSLEECKTLLQLAHTLSVWFMQVYGDYSYESSGYVFPDDNHNQSGHQALLDENEKLALELEQTRSAMLQALAAKAVQGDQRKKQADRATRKIKLTERESRYLIDEQLQIRLTDMFTAPLPEFHKRRIVFWKDEDGEFIEQVDKIALSEVSLIKLTGSNNFAVKKLLSADDLTGNYLVYSPIAYESIQDNWLLDIELYSEEFRADMVSMQMDELHIEPTAVMRKTVKLYSKFFENKERRTKLQKIGNTYSTPLALHTDIMAVLCGASGGTMQDIIFAVLLEGFAKEDNKALDSIRRFGNIEAFWQLIQRYTGYIDADDRGIDELAAHILLTALSQTISDSYLQGLERFISDSNKAYCYQLVDEWQRDENIDEVIELFRVVEYNLHLLDRFSKMDTDVLLKCDTFPAINECMLVAIFSEIAENVIKVDQIYNAVENRRTSAWYELSADYFDCLYYIAKMQEFFLANIQGFHFAEAKTLWQSYTNYFYVMDSHYRHFHISFNNTIKAPNPALDDLIRKCADVIEGLYHNWFLKGLTENWTGLIAEGFENLGYVSELPRQRGFYTKYVAATVKSGKRAFVIVSDALRYEVAAQLAESLSHHTKGKVDVAAMQAIFPSTTKFGMAALLPNKIISINEKYEVDVDEKSTKDTPQREAVLIATNQNSVAVAYNKLLEMKQQERRELVQGKEVIYIYHSAIDAIGEMRSTEKKVFEACDTAIEEISSIVRMIVNDFSGTDIFVTADHGFLYTYKPLEESQKISRQTFDGDVYELGRRYALVAPFTTSEHLLPVNIGEEMAGIPIRGYAPQYTVRIKVAGGGDNYVHGGISLQEIAVPVIVYKAMRSRSKKYIEVTNPGLTLISESRKIANLMFSLEFMQRTPVGDKVQPCNYSLYFIGDDGAKISDEQTVIADRSSANASERVFRVRFTLKSMSFDRNIAYRLIIANDTDAPEEVEFRIDIAFADDFGFDLE